MKTILRLIILMSAVLFMLACNNDATLNSTKDSTQTASIDDHEHSFRCPMHPEVVGKEGDTCPICGMKLEHSDEAPTPPGTYSMQFVSTPALVAPNKEVRLSFTPKKKDAPNDQVALDIEHEKKIHLILVSDDLSWFDHIHPEYNVDGSYTVITTFPAPGKYLAYADYKPTGASHMVDKIEISVTGNAPVEKKFLLEKLSGNSGQYAFELKPTGGKLITGALMHISGIVKKNGKTLDANTLGDYLGAKAHFVLISVDEKKYLHVHPGVDKGQFDLHTTFEKPGTYRGWIQFIAEAKLYTIDFTMNVTQGTPDDIKKANQAHTEHHTGGGNEHQGH